MNGAAPGARQHGVVLLVSLLVLLVLGIIATTVARTGLLQLHMAGNEEARIDALQRALAAVDSVLASAPGTPLVGGLGYRLCTPGSADPGCTEYSLALVAGLEPEVGRLDASLARVEPLEMRMPVMAESTASSTVFYRVAKFELSATYDGTGRGLGRATLAQGVLVRRVAEAPGGGVYP